MFYNYLIFNMVTLSLRILLKYCVSPYETKCFTPRNGLFQALKQFLKLIATGEEMVKWLHFTRKLFTHRRDREKVKGEMER